MPFSQECLNKLKKNTHVAVVGGGLAGLMAARHLGQHGIKVTVFEARPQVGGRVLSNRKFSNGRITEEGAELIGSFHTRWLTLALEYGLAMISRMPDPFYEREGLNIKLTLDKPLSMKEIIELFDKEMPPVLTQFAKMAENITDPSQPWNEKKPLLEKLEKYDNMSVAKALTDLGVKPTSRLWKGIEYVLVNNEVAPLDEMNFLGLLCKVRGGQSLRFGQDRQDESNLMGYWDELEIFRCADGCDKLATEMAKEVQTKYKAKINLRTAVTHINLSKQGVVLWVKTVKKDGTIPDGPPFPITGNEYVILAIPPSVWDKVEITADGKNVDPGDEIEIGLMGGGPAVKFFSDVKERFWIKQKSAPVGGSLTLGQVWEGTDNQMRVDKQGIILSVFAGPIITGPKGPRAPTPDEFKKKLRRLYPDYTSNLTKTLFRDWPNVPFIKIGYSSPKINQIFTIGKKLSEPFHDRLFFAGEHTQMDFFGYMEGALRSGERAAEILMLKSCGL